MIELIIFLFLIYIITLSYTSTNYQAQVGNYETINFKISGGKSLETFNILKDNNASSQTLIKFATMEDRFLEYEKISVCRGQNTLTQAIAMSQQIKDTFPACDFSYHSQHLKQISSPEKMVNRYLVC